MSRLEGDLRERNGVVNALEEDMQALKVPAGAAEAEAGVGRAPTRRGWWARAAAAAAAAAHFSRITASRIVASSPRMRARLRVGTCHARVHTCRGAHPLPGGPSLRGAARRRQRASPRPLPRNLRAAAAAAAGPGAGGRAAMRRPGWPR